MDDVVEDGHVECGGLRDAAHPNCFGDGEGLNAVVLDKNKKAILDLSLA